MYAHLLQLIIIINIIIIIIIVKHCYSTLHTY